LLPLETKVFASKKGGNVQGGKEPLSPIGSKEATRGGVKIKIEHRSCGKLTSPQGLRE